MVAMLNRWAGPCAVLAGHVPADRRICAITAAAQQVDVWPSRIGELELGTPPNDDLAHRHREWLTAALLPHVNTSGSGESLPHVAISAWRRVFQELLMAGLVGAGLFARAMVSSLPVRARI
jgi:hypothetical protein